jgi:hypothetical protein
MHGNVCPLWLEHKDPDLQRKIKGQFSSLSGGIDDSGRIPVHGEVLYLIDSDEEV